MSSDADQINESAPIRARSILPARRQDIELHTADGLTLVGELARPLDRPPVATLITLHPQPTHGGCMDSHLYKKAAFRLPALADLAIVRFNTRGTESGRGASQGEFDYADRERYDVAAAIQYAELNDLPHVWLVGWSFGTDLVLMHGQDPTVEGAILLSPPLRYSQPDHLQAWAQGGKPVLALVPEFDTYLPPHQARERLAAIPQAEVVCVEGAKHLWVGETHVRRALDEIVNAVRPGFGPLPTTWSGPVQEEPAAVRPLSSAARRNTGQDASHDDDG